MGSFAARAVLCLIFGFFIYETIIKANKVFELALNPLIAIVPAALVGVIHEIVIRKLRADEETVHGKRRPEPKLEKAFFVLAWVIAAGFLLCMFAFWAGVIVIQIIYDYSDYTKIVP